MRVSCLFIASLTVLSLSARETVGLTLSGGGAKGIAHIGVIQALEDNGIPVDFVTGTSMGSIVGGFYACGYSPKETIELIKSKGFGYWSSGKVDPALTPLYDQPEKTPAFLTVNLGNTDSTLTTGLLPTSLINPLPMSFAFMELFAPYTAQCGGDFDRLFVPFRCVTSDVYAHKKIVCRSGELGDAIRASMSFPLVFRPIEMDSVPVYDGGIYDNFPFDVMEKDFRPDFLIGVDVTTPSTKPPSQNNMIDVIEDMVIQPNDAVFPAEKGIRIHIKLSQFSLLDWEKAQEIYNIGYRHGLQYVDSIKKRTTARVAPEEVARRRAAFKAKTPAIEFDSVSVTGATAYQNRFLEYVFRGDRHAAPDTFGMHRAKESFYRAIASGRISNLVPHAHYNPTTGLSLLDVKATVKHRFNVGLGGYLTSGTNSFLFLDGGYNSMSFHAVSASVKAWAGQSYLALQGDASVYLKTARPSSLGVKVVVSREKFSESEKLFFQENNPTFVTASETYGDLRYEMPASRRSVFSISLGYGHLTDRYRSLSDGAEGADRLLTDVGRLRAEFHHLTLDNSNAPTEGAEYRAVLMGVYGHYRLKPAGIADPPRNRQYYWQAELVARNYFNLSRHFSLGTEVDILASSRRLNDSYYASIVSAPAFRPIASSYNAFNPAFSANAWGSLGVVPIWKMTSTLHVRGNFYGFLPYRKILADEDGKPRYARRFSHPQFLGQISADWTLPFATLSLYGNYSSYPARNWNCGISFGLFLLAPKFLR